jgi:hypothetical protein
MYIQIKNYTNSNGKNTKTGGGDDQNFGRKSFSINDIKINDKLVNLYTGLQSYAVFECLFNRLSERVHNLTYKNYKQPTSGMKRGPKTILSPEDEMF